MRGWLIAGLLLLTVPGTPAQDGSNGFARHLPSGIGDVSGWQTITGDFETAGARGSYLFYVNPRRQAIYQLMRYRVEFLDPLDELARQRGSSERVAFVRKPGSREPMLCWQLEDAGQAWRSVPAGTEEYQLEMATLIQVLAVHREVRHSRAP